MIGGERDGSSSRNEVWIYDPQNRFARTQGPSLTSTRNAHSCSTMKDGEKTLIVVAGGSRPNSDFLDSVEIYDPTDNTWHSGKKIFLITNKLILMYYFQTKINQKAYHEHQSNYSLFLHYRSILTLWSKV